MQAKKLLAERSLADDLTVVTIDADTPDETMAALDRVTASCGVLLPQSNAMRGLESASVCLLAMDGAGQPVASAASVGTNHRDNPLAGEAWWGMLATPRRPARRGDSDCAGCNGAAGDAPAARIFGLLYRCSCG